MSSAIPRSVSVASGQQQSPISFTNIMGQGRINQLGGVFINGRPLPHETRVRIIELAAKGVKPCRISKDLRVSHGAVSKILNRFQETGSISPGQIGGNPRCRLTIQAVERWIIQLKRHSPTMSGADIRTALIRQGVCIKSNAPTVSSINRHLRSQTMRRKIEAAQHGDTRSYKLEDGESPSGTTPPEKVAINSSATDNGAMEPRCSFYSDGTPVSPTSRREMSAPHNVLIGPACARKRKLPLSHSIDNILNGQYGDSSITYNEQSNETIPNSPSSASSSCSDGENFATCNGSPALKRSKLLALDATSGEVVESRRNRTSFTGDQLRALENAFAEAMYPTNEEKERLMKQTQLDEDKIVTWFSNRRARWRKVFINNGLLPLSSAMSLTTGPISRRPPFSISPAAALNQLAQLAVPHPPHRHSMNPGIGNILSLNAAPSSLFPSPPTPTLPLRPSLMPAGLQLVCAPALTVKLPAVALNNALQFLSQISSVGGGNQKQETD